MENNSLYGQVEIYLKSLMFWVFVFSTWSASFLLDIVWYIFEQINHVESVKLAIEGRKATCNARNK